MLEGQVSYEKPMRRELSLTSLLHRVAGTVGLSTGKGRCREHHSRGGCQSGDHFDCYG